MHSHITHRFVLALLFALLPATGLLAQIGGGGDPRQEIKEIAEAIEKQLKEIDELLLESGKAGQDRGRPKELLEQASEGTKVVEDGLEKLIEKLTEMKNQGGGGQQSQQQQQQQGGQQQPQDGQQQQGQQGGQGRNRRENQAPDFVDQGERQGQQGEQQQPGQEQQQGQNRTGQQEPQQGDQPRGGQDSQDAGQNRTGQNPAESPTGPGQPGQGEGEWGNLQPYLNFLKNRGATPKVPEKFRKYYEAYLKNKQKGDK